MRRTFVLLLTLAMVVGVVAIATPATAAEPEVITVMGQFTGSEQEALEAEFAAYAADKDVEIIYEPYFGNDELFDRIFGPEPPDIILSPQPGTIRDLAGELVDLGDVVNERSLRRDFGNYLIDVVSVDGVILGAPVDTSLKSLVWYKPDVFAAAGYQIPTTFTELVALSDSMVADGRTPWCNFIEAGPATGWVGTDWIEDLLLGAEGGQVYDQWVAHDILFQDPRVEAAFDRYQQMIDSAGYVFERGLMLDVGFFYNSLPLAFEDCLMHRQASFFASFIDFFGFDLADFDTFKFPSVDPAFADSVVGAGNHLAALNERNVVRQLVRFMVSQRFGRTALVDEPGWILPNVRFNTDRYSSDLKREWAEAIQASLRADIFRFDGSDLMPPQVGSGTEAGPGSFWTGIVDLVSGLRTVPQVLSDIDASWPS